MQEPRRERSTKASPARHRLLYVQPAEVFGGAERQGVLHMAGLRRHGFEVVPVVGPGKMILPELEALGVEDYVHLDRFPHERYAPAALWGRLAGGLEFARDWLNVQRQLRRLCEERRIDIILANRSTGWIAASYVAHQLGLPLVWRGGGRITSRGEVALLKLLGLRFRPDLLVANCEAVREMLGAYLECQSVVVRNGVDHERFDPRRVEPDLRAELGIAPRAPVIGFPSRPAPEKGLELFARAVARAAREVPGLRVVVAGEFGWRDHYERLFRELRLPQVIFLGHVPQVERVYRISDIVALTSPSRSIEGSPNTLLEAMAMECPVVATNVGGVAEAVTDGREGLLVPAGDATAFGDALLALLRDPALRRRMGAAGRATILERHSSDVVLAQLAGLLRLTLARRGSRRLMAGVRGAA